MRRLPAPVCLSVLAALAACDLRPARTVRIAVTVPLSGALAADGTGLLRGVELAVSEAAPFSEPSLKVEVVGIDDRGDPAHAEEAARRAAQDPDVMAVVGHYTSGCSLPASRLYAQAGLAMVTPTSTNPELTVQQTRADWTGPRIVFRLPPSDDIQGSFAADFAHGRWSLGKMAVLHDASPYGLGLAEEFRKEFLRLGGRVVLFDAVAKGASDFREPLAAVRAAKPDGIFFGGMYPEAGLLLRQARELRINATFVAGDGAKADDLFTIAGPAADGAYVTVLGVPVEHLPAAEDFVARYKAKFGGAAPRAFDHYAYEAARMVLGALRAAGPDRGRIIARIAGGRHQGMLGEIVFDHKGDTTKRLVTMTRADFAEKRFQTVF